MTTDRTFSSFCGAFWTRVKNCSLQESLLTVNENKGVRRRKKFSSFLCVHTLSKGNYNKFYLMFCNDNRNNVLGRRARARISRKSTIIMSNFSFIRPLFIPQQFSLGQIHQWNYIDENYENPETGVKKAFHYHFIGRNRRQREEILLNSRYIKPKELREKRHKHKKLSAPDFQ